jgi:hypothetical protein
LNNQKRSKLQLEELARALIATVNSYFNGTVYFLQSGHDLSESAEQVIGREAETATLLVMSSVKFRRAWWRFPPASTPPFGVFPLLYRCSIKIIFGLW